MSAVLFGSISTVADTSELQRESFNRAFDQHGLDWQWSQDDYRAMLDSNGGKDRIAAYAESRGETVDATAVHATKSELFQQSLSDSSISPRDGVLDTIKAAKGKGMHVALVTTTSAENIAALMNALQPELSATDFDLVVDADSAKAPKPDGAAYELALSGLGEQAGQCVAIEDNVGGVQSAQAAGVACAAFPNTNTAGHDFAAASTTVSTLDLSELERLMTA